MQKLIGTILEYFRIGRNGIRVANNNGVMEVQNAAGTALARARVADPAAPTDAVNRGTLDTALGARDGAIEALQTDMGAAQADLAALQGQVAGFSGAGLDRTVAIGIGTDASYEATSQLPAGAVVKEVKLKVTAGYPAGTEIRVGSAGVPDMLVGAADNDPSLAELQEVELWALLPSALTPRVSISGNPAGGAGLVAITYTTPQG